MSVKSFLPRKTHLWRAFVWCLCLLLAGLAGAVDPGFPREKGAFYLEDFFKQPYRLRVLADAPIYYNADAARFLGTLRRAQVVDLLAVTGNGALVRVRGQAQQGQVSGWVSARDVTALDPSFVDGLHRATERREQIRALTAAGEVALGMTPEEVAFILGQPARKTSHTDAGGTAETWDFTRFESVPRQVVSTDPAGRLYTTVVYEKVAVGSYAVTFAGGLSRAVDQTDKTGLNVASTTPIKTVPPPVVFHF